MHSAGADQGGSRAHKSKQTKDPVASGESRLGKHSIPVFRIQAAVTGDEGVEGRRGKVQGRGCDYLPKEPIVLFLAIT